MHQTNNNLIVAGYDEVYRSTTAGAIWDSVSFNVSNGGAIRSIALAPSDENYIYASTYSKIKVTKNAGQSWTYIKPGLPNYNITDVAVSTTNPDRVWVTLSDYNNVHKVYESTDAGDNWTNISGSNLPALPVNCIVYQGGANEDLYIGTDVGVYHKDNTMSDWGPYMFGLPNVIVKELEIHYDAGIISAATFGRGVWQSPLKTTSSTSTNEFSSIDFSIFPNPAKDKITIQGIHGAESEIIIYSLEGKKILTANKETINTTGLRLGCYIVEVKSESFISRKKLIIK
jgi:hypothetical protein